MAEGSSSTRPGCGTSLAVIGAASLAGGIYLMSRWDSLGGGAKSGGIVLIVLGTVILLPFILFAAVKIALKMWFGKLMKDLSDAGKQMVAGSKAMYEKVHQFRAATDDDFDVLDRSAYDTAQEQLTSLGLRHLGDIVDETIEEL